GRLTPRCRCGRAWPRSQARSARSAARIRRGAPRRGSRRAARASRSQSDALPARLHDTRCMRVGSHDVPISNPDKVFFPSRGLTKGGLVEYYIGVAEHTLPHLRRRPFHMKRFPNGVDQDFFHQKRVPAKHPDYVDEVFVSFPSGHSTVFAVVDNAAALAWVANLGCIELHTWASRVPEIALVVHEVMDELALRSYPKTSGATGLHILAPIKPELRFPDVRRFAKAL